MNKYNLMIVEDHALIRFGLKTAFETKDFISNIFEAPNAEEAIDITQKNKIDVIIMDLGLPNIDGIEATRQIKAINPAVKIVILTSHNSDDEVLESVKAGANAYCSKDINPERLSNVVLSVIEGAAWFAPNIAKVILDAASKPDNSSKNDAVSEKKINKATNDYNLTQREKQVLKLIREGHNNSEIAEKLYVSVNTAKVHVSSIMQKLGVEDRTKAAIKALNDNIIWKILKIQLK